MRLFLLFLLLSLGMPLLVSAGPVCDINVSTQNGCVPQPVTFSLKTTSGSPVKKYYWDFDDGDSSSQASPTHIYKKSGKYIVKLVVLFTDGSSCSTQIAAPVIIHGNPVADFNLKDHSQIVLCHKGDKFCFKNLSITGTDKAPIVTYLWNFGNGDTTSAKDPCYAFTDSGTFVTTLQVIDSNGCKGLVQKYINVRFSSDLGLNATPRFAFTKTYDCKKNTVNVFFSNPTDTAGKDILKYYWDFDDSAGVDTCYVKDTACMKHWKNVSHTYTKTNIYYPSLTVVNKYGCLFTYRFDTGLVIFAEPFKLKVKIYPLSAGCFSQDSLIFFEAPYSQEAAYYNWDFNDPKSKTNFGSLSSTSHTFSGPGTYSVRLRLKIGTCLYDTVLCNAIHLYGPMAHIMQKRFDKKPWDSVPLPAGNSLIPPSEYRYHFDTSCSGPDSVVYYTYSSHFAKASEPIYDPCRYDTGLIAIDTIVKCYKKAPPKKVVLNYKNRITGYKDSTITTVARHVWFPSNPLPTGDVYAAPPFVDDPWRINDTSLFSCHLPQKIKFTNFSIKYRGQDAIDDYPTLIPDTCHHKAYPFASDSLNYHWDFGEGTASESTENKPDPYAHTSTEKLPVHIYTHEGCYWVKMVAQDTATGCYDIDSLPVVTQAPDAGWGPQYSNISRMTYDQQMALNPANGRRGLVFYGLPCEKDTQFISLAETLPSCYKRSFSIVFDSAGSAAGSCDKKTVKFFNKDAVEQMGYRYVYRDTGYKTVGLVIQNSAECTDTVWYHNYKYLHGTYPALSVSTEHLCPGESLKLSSLVPEQQGIKFLVVKYVLLGDSKYDTLLKEKTDTFPYALHTSGSRTDTVTSTVQTKGWSIYDGSYNFNSLYDTISKSIGQSGHLEILSIIYSRFGCIDSALSEATVGFDADFAAANNTLCQQDTATFYDLLYYYLPFRKNSIGFDQKLYWDNPDSARGGRHPLHPETVQWDMDGDGKIDFTGPDPHFHYSKPGTYTVTMYATDSLGCVLAVQKKDFIKVIGIDAHFGVASPGPLRYCGPQFFKFVDSSRIIKGADTLTKYQIASWTWDFGDGTPPITITDSAKKNVTHLYLKNGDYKVKLIVSTSTNVGKNGCVDTFEIPVRIIGPTSEFEVAGPDAGCVPFTLTVVDKSIKAKIREWILGDGTVQSSKGEDTVRLVYKRPGIYCPSFIVADTLIDLLGQPLYCTDTFPSPHCRYKVYVYKINTQQLVVSDTLLCANRDVATFMSIPDTGYTSWTISYGDKRSHTAVKPVFNHTYTEAGKYTAVIRGTGAKCPDTSFINVRVIDIKADFGMDTAKNDTPTFFFTNRCFNGRRFVWDFDDGTDSIVTNTPTGIIHTFQRAGIIKVCLTAYNEKGCPDKICKEINLITSLWVPNVFTPNGDGDNDRFVALIHGEIYYDMRIYNRWGEQVFEGHNRYDTWDGTNKKTGKLCPDGTYYYVFNYRHIGGLQKEISGTVTLIRN